MAVLINRAVLHVAYNDGREPVVSGEELDFESEACSEFINKHIKKLMGDPACKEAVFNEGSEVYGFFSEYKKRNLSFMDFALNVFEILSGLVGKYPSIPSGDILIVDFTKDDTNHIGILKLNFKECFTHKIDVTENGVDAQIIKYNSVLPFSSGRVEEACIIPFEPMVIRLTEKAYVIDNEARNYFSELFLDCAPQISKKEAVEIINSVTEEINEKYFDEQLEPYAKVKTAIMEEAEKNEGIVRMETIADEAFGENIEIKKAYIETLRESGITEDLDLGEKYTRKQFGVQTFKSENGVEIKYPSELSFDDDAMEIFYHADKSVSITFKNLRKK